MNYKFCPLCGNKLSSQVFDGQEKTACPSSECGYVHWDNPTPVILIIVELNGKYILTHNVEWPNWKYSFISGFLDTNEHPESAAIREVKEELNLEVQELKLINLCNYKKLNQLMIAYHAKVSGTIALNEEHDEYKLLSLEELRRWKLGESAASALNAMFPFKDNNDNLSEC